MGKARCIHPVTKHLAIGALAVIANQAIAVNQHLEKRVPLLEEEIDLAIARQRHATTDSQNTIN